MEQLVPATRRKDFEFRQRPKKRGNEDIVCEGTRGEEETAPVSRDSDLQHSS
jgi:hypothetical protein